MIKPYRVGFIGGSINSAVGRTHKIAIELDGQFSLEAGCFSLEKVENEATATAYQVKPSRVYSNHIQLLELEIDNLDLIVILTPTNHHKNHVIDALSYGYNVVCEKALSCNVKEAIEIKNILKKKTGFLKVIYNYQGYPMVRELKNIIELGKLGHLQQIFAEMPQEGFERVKTDSSPIKPQEWRLHDGLIPTVSLDLGVHLHMLVKYLSVQKPINVAALSSNYGNFKNIIDNVNCIFNYTNNLSVSMWFGKTALGIRNGLRIRLFGTKGSAEWVQEDPEKLRLGDIFGNIHTIDRGSPNLNIANKSRYQRFKPGHPSGFIEAFANYYNDISQALTNKTKSNDKELNEECFGIEESIEGLEMFEKIALASHTRSWVDF